MYNAQSQYYLPSYDCVSKLVSFADRNSLRQATKCVFNQNEFSDNIYIYFLGFMASNNKLLLQLQKTNPVNLQHDETFKHL